MYCYPWSSCHRAVDGRSAVKAVVFVAKSHTIKFGGSKVKLSRSETLIAVRAHAGMSKSMENAIRSIAVDTPVERRGRLAGFDLVHIQASPQKVSQARTNLREAASVNQEVAVYHTSKDNVPFVPVGTIYLSFQPNQPEAAKQAVLDKYALQPIAPERDGILTVRVTQPGIDSVEVAAKLQREKSVVAAEPDLATPARTSSFVIPTDQLFPLQWHLENTGMNGAEKRGADSRVVAAWKALDGLGSSDIVVGIIDDGFDLAHPDLADKAVFPWDFERNSADVHPEPDLTNPSGGNWHGTCCAGVAVGKAGGGQIIGAAPNARLLPVRRPSTLTVASIVEWIDYMREKGAWVVSCSWGAKAAVYPPYQLIANAIARCAKEGRNGKGCVIVFAAGNSAKDVNDPPRSQNSLATYPGVMAVSACSSLDEFSDYSNFGKEIWVCSPSSGLDGLNIITADATGTYVDAAGQERSNGYTPGDYYLYFKGTSSSCPLVAGICALVLSANPELTSEEVREIIKRTARKIGPTTEYEDGHSAKFGFGCVNAEEAVKEALRLAPRVAAAALRARVPSPFAARAPHDRGAMPNLFNSTIAEALSAPGATPESVAAAIASTPYFLKAVQLGMDHVPPPIGAPTKSQATRSKLAKALSAPTSGTMF